MIARLAFLALVLAIANSIPTTHVPNTVSSKEYPTFEEYCVKFNKEYDVHEYPFRKALYEKTLSSIITHNSENHSFKKGVNQFTDQTTAEFSRMFGYNKAMSWGRREMRKQRQAVEYRSEYFLNRTKSSRSDVSSIDWSALGATTAVKNQGHCGSCWAFAGTEAIESNVFLETGQLLTLAPQVYVDCVQNPNHCGGSGGCDGATCDLLFDYAVTGGGAFEVDYPYNASQGQCQSYVHQVSIKGWVDVKENDDAALEQALLLQPITISVAASSWATYFGGVFPFSECDTDINHAVLLVGYGTDPVNGPYWKVQNSWGPTWGEDGFIRLARSSECGIDTKPLDGTGCPGGPSQVTVCGTCGMLFDSVYPTGGSVVKQRRF